MENTEFPEAEDGQLLLIDLAGSENAADSQVCIVIRKTGCKVKAWSNNLQLPPVP